MLSHDRGRAHTMCTTDSTCFLFLLPSTYLLDAHAVGLGVPHRAHVRPVALGNFGGAAVLDEHGLAAPLHRHRVAHGNVAEVKLRRRERQHVLFCLTKGMSKNRAKE